MRRKVLIRPPKLSDVLVPATEPVDVDLSTLPLCPDAEDFVSWIDKTLPAILTKISTEALDKAMLAVTKEYLYRRNYTKIHKQYTCLPDVFHERMEQLLEKQLELARHKFLEPPPPPKETRAALVPALYIGSGDALGE